jgi:hypothetical protein
MSLPAYQHLTLKTSSLEELEAILDTGMNLRHPVVLNLKTMALDQQRETIGLVENFFVSNNVSFRFPYPVYVVSDHEPGITRLPLIDDPARLPKFFSPREAKMNVKESQLAARNKLLQQEVKNADASSNAAELDFYGESHRKVFELEVERKFYHGILNGLLKAGRRG